MATRQIFDSSAMVAVDKKGRLALPLDYRRTIEANHGPREVSIADHVSLPCLVGTDRAWLRELSARIDDRQQAALNAGEAVDEGELAAALDNFEHPGFDEAGRFQLPTFLAAHAKIADLAYFRATSHGFQIWNPTVLVGEAKLPERLRAKIRWELEQRGVKA